MYWFFIALLLIPMSLDLMILSHETVSVDQDIDLKKRNKAFIVYVNIWGLGSVHKQCFSYDPKDV